MDDQNSRYSLIAMATTAAGVVGFVASAVIFYAPEPIKWCCAIGFVCACSVGFVVHHLTR